MNDNDKITITIGKLKQLINEAKHKNSPFNQFVNSIFNEINEDNFSYSMRFKWANVDGIDEEKHIGSIYWQTQEDFYADDFDDFVEEVRRCIKVVIDKPMFRRAKAAIYPFKIKIKCISRDGKWAGYGTKTLSQKDLGGNTM